MEETQYLNAVSRVLEHGADEGDTISLFGDITMRFDLDNGFPLLTTKKMYWKGVVEELLWFISGSTDAKELHDKGVTIWDANTSRAYLDSRGLYRLKEGQGGKIYGHQWTNYGGVLGVRGTGVNQLQYVIDMIKKAPHSRRIIMNAWNPCDLNDCCLPPCHVLWHWKVVGDRLDVILYQRSGDMALGVPFNIASSALLLTMVAKVTGYKPGHLVHHIGDAHIYIPHAEPLGTQLVREPYPMPKIEIEGDFDDLFTIQSKHIKLHGYKSHPSIKMPLFV
jgi:thymidylate synthase